MTGNVPSIMPKGRADSIGTDGDGRLRPAADEHCGIAAGAATRTNNFAASLNWEKNRADTRTKPNMAIRSMAKSPHPWSVKANDHWRFAREPIPN